MDLGDDHAVPVEQVEHKAVIHSVQLTDLEHAQHERLKQHAQTNSPLVSLVQKAPEKLQSMNPFLEDLNRFADKLASNSKMEDWATMMKSLLECYKDQREVKADNPYDTLFQLLGQALHQLSAPDAPTDHIHALLKHQLQQLDGKVQIAQALAKLQKTSYSRKGSTNTKHYETDPITHVRYYKGAKTGNRYPYIQGDGKSQRNAKKAAEERGLKRKRDSNSGEEKDKEKEKEKKDELDEKHVANLVKKTKKLPLSELLKPLVPETPPRTKRSSRTSASALQAVQQNYGDGEAEVEVIE